MQSQLSPQTEEDHRLLAQHPQLIERVIVALLWEALYRECLLTNLSTVHDLTTEEIGRVSRTNLSALLEKIAPQVAKQALSDMAGGEDA